LKISRGGWPLYRLNPALAAEGKNPLQFESKEPKMSYSEYAYGQNRFRTLKAKSPEHAAKLMEQAEADIKSKYEFYKKLAALEI